MVRTDCRVAARIVKARAYGAARYDQIVAGMSRNITLDPRTAERAAVTWAFVLMSAAGVLWGGYEILEASIGSGDSPLDDRAIQWFREATSGELIGPAWLSGAMVDITALGSTVVVAIVTIVTFATLLLQDRRRSGLVFVLSIIGARVLTTAMKAMFGSERPDIVPSLTEVMTSSFPSAHALMSAATYTTLAGVVSVGIHRPMGRNLCFVLAIALIALIGLSRVMLGVHRPDEVLAGWTMGFAWALGTILILIRVGRRDGRQVSVDSASRDSSASR